MRMINEIMFLLMCSAAAAGAQAGAATEAVAHLVRRLIAIHGGNR